MTEYYDEGAPQDEYIKAIQRRINDGSIWQFKGSAGREAMRLIEAGYCMLPKVAHKDYWGNIVPSRAWLKPGSKGTWGYVAARMGRSWAQRMARA